MMMRRSGSMRNWTAIMVVLVCCLATRINGSAIPMWEFLEREEKMSHLYTIFSKQVARYCSDSSLPDCTKNILISGIRNLANMNENELDRMDPYQRDANDIIWRALIGNNRLPGKYQDEDSYYTPEADPLATSEGDNNGLGEGSAPTSDYVRPSEHTGPYLVGPMVIRVFPDGRPVPEDIARPLPRDEDVDDTKYSRVPSIAEIETSNNRKFHYRKPSYELSARANKLNAWTNGKSFQRPSLIATTKNSQYRGVNPLFRDRRVTEISNSARTLRYY